MTCIFLKAATLFCIFVHLYGFESPTHTDSKSALQRKDPKDIKALYRRAQGALGANDFEVAVKDCKRILELEPENKDTGPVGGSDRSHLKWCDTNGVKTSRHINL